MEDFQVVDDFVVVPGLSDMDLVALDRDLSATAALGVADSATAAVGVADPAMSALDVNSLSTEEHTMGTEDGTEELESTSNGTSTDGEAALELAFPSDSAPMTDEQFLELMAAAFRDGTLTETRDGGIVHEVALVPVLVDEQLAAPQEEAGGGLAIDPRLTLLDTPAAAPQAVTAAQHLDKERTDESKVPPSHRQVQCVPCDQVIKGGVKNIKLHLASNRHRRHSHVADASVRWSCVICTGGRHIRSFTRRADLKRHIESSHPEQVVVDADGRRTVPDDLLMQGRVVVPT